LKFTLFRNKHLAIGQKLLSFYKQRPKIEAESIEESPADTFITIAPRSPPKIWGEQVHMANKKKWRLVVCFALFAKTQA